MLASWDTSVPSALLNLLSPVAALKRIVKPSLIVLSSQTCFSSYAFGFRTTVISSFRVICKCWDSGSSLKSLFRNAAQAEEELRCVPARVTTASLPGQFRRDDLFHASTTALGTTRTKG